MHKANKLFNKYHMLPLQSWHFNIERCYYGFLNIFPSFQVVKQMKPIVAASSHVLGNKDVDEGEDLFGDRSHFQWPVYSLLTRLNTVKHISFKLCFYWREKKKKALNVYAHSASPVRPCTLLFCWSSIFSVILPLVFCLLFTETQTTSAMLIKQFAQHHSADFQAAMTSLPGEQQAKLSAAISAS